MTLHNGQLVQFTIAVFELFLATSVTWVLVLVSLRKVCDVFSIGSMIRMYCWLVCENVDIMWTTR